MNYTFIDFAKEVLRDADQPLTYQQIWETGCQKALDEKVNSTGKTPWSTLGARLHVDVRDNDNTEFIKIRSRPARFFLKSRKSEISDNFIEKIESIEHSTSSSVQSQWHERLLHPLVSYFVYSNPTFSYGKPIVTKTIFHEKSKKPGYSEWSHPDLVGFYLPLEDWNDNIIEFNKVSDNNALRLFSFEVKKEITKSNYRESFFQAVSNSSWAHEGYLITANVKRDDDLLSELQRLSMSFGIGIIYLDLEDIDASSILFPAKIKNQLDWETMNKLSQQNRDFAKFLKDIKIDFDSKRIHKNEYDDILPDPEEYIKKNISKEN